MTLHHAGLDWSDSLTAEETGIDQSGMHADTQLQLALVAALLAGEHAAALRLLDEAGMRGWSEMDAAIATVARLRLAARLSYDTSVRRGGSTDEARTGFIGGRAS